MRALVFASLLSLLAPSIALAHGGRPQTYDALFGATDADIVVPGTFGVMGTLDGGATWDWLCIEGMPDARRGTIRPSTRTPMGTILFAENFGLLVGRDRACDPAFDAMLHDRFVADVTMRPGGGFAAVSSDADRANSLFVSSTGDDGFAPFGDDFPMGLLPERVRYAPSDATRVYVSGETMITGTSMFTASLLVSTDAGMHWSVIDVPLMTDESVLRVVAVDPTDADHFFLVAQSSTSDRVIEATMAGAMMHDILQIAAVPVAVNRPFALGFASDGTIWFGNTMAGLYRILPGDVPRTVDKFLRVACVVPHGDDVYLCGDGLDDPFALGVQHPGTDYAPVPLMQFAQLTSQRTCGTSLDSICMGWWNDLLIDTGRPELIPPDAGTDAATIADAGADAGTASIDGGTTPHPTSSCTCRASAPTRARAWPALIALLAVVQASRRRTSRSAIRARSLCAASELGRARSSR